MPTSEADDSIDIDSLHQEFGACVVDATSSWGLRRLARAHPEHWREILNRGANLHRKPLDQQRTLAELFSGGHFDLGLPQADAGPGALRRNRGCLRRLREVLGHVAVARVTEGSLRRHEARYRAARKGRLSAELLRRDLNLLRRAVWLAQDQVGEAQIDRVSPEMRRKKANLARRLVPMPWVVAAILHATDDLNARAAVALAAGAGMLEGEILPLRAGHFGARGGALWVEVVGHRVRGRPGRRAHRCFPLPQWVTDVILMAFPNLLGGPRTALLFPHRDRLGQHRTSFRRTLRRACELAGVESYTFGALRRLYQLVIRANGGPRVAVRGTMWQHPRAERDAHLQAGYAASVGSVLCRWTELGKPPGAVLEGQVDVPRAAPKGVKAFQPELKRLPRHRPPPPTCQASPPEPPERPRTPEAPVLLTPSDASPAPIRSLSPGPVRPVSPRPASGTDDELAGLWVFLLAAVIGAMTVGEAGTPG